MVMYPVVSLAVFMESGWDYDNSLTHSGMIPQI